MSVQDDSDENVKAQVSSTDAMAILEAFYGFKGGTIEQLNGYDDLNYHYREPVSCRNENVKNVPSSGYTLKIINSKDSQNKDLHDAQSKLLLHLRDHGIKCPEPIKNKCGNYYCTKILPVKSDTCDSEKEHVVKLLQFLPGKLLKQMPNNYRLYYDIGKVAAITDNAAKDFHHHVFETHESIWHLNMVPYIQKYLCYVDDKKMKELIERGIGDFVTKVEPVMDPNKKQIIHGDLNTQNILCEEENGQWVVSAIIDFGDCHKSYREYEVAICMCYTMLDCVQKQMDPFIGSGHALAGYYLYSDSFELNHVLLKRCIAARLCQSYTLGVYNTVLQPDNKYVSENLNLYKPLTMDIFNMPNSELQDVWNRVLSAFKNS